MPLAQESRRVLEGAVRVRAVAIGRWAHGQGLLRIEVAAWMGLSPRTLSAWRSRWSVDRLRPRARGRRWVRSSRAQRNEVIRFIDERGPCVGLPSLRAAFPQLRRCELQDRLARYNGGCERNNGCLKAQTQHAAALAGHADWWSSQDTTSALATLNRTVRPWGYQGPTPEERCNTREPLGEPERTEFRAVLAEQQRVVRLEMNHPFDVVLDHYRQAAVDRIATQRALLEQGLLKISRRPITLPLKQLKLAKIL